MTDKLAQLLARCKCGVHITVNDHRDVYQSAEDWLNENGLNGLPVELNDDVRAAIIASGNIVDLHFYPDTPIGFYRIVHHDMNAALDAALACVAQR